jgi:putative ABC transport system ATP-binding protein
MYQLSAVVKNYRKGRGTVAALQGVDLAVEDGEWLAVQGPTGHGKSTLLQIMGAIDRPTSGIVELQGADLATMRETSVTRLRAHSIGFIFQTFNLIPTLSAQENVEKALAPLALSAAQRRANAEEALAAVGLVTGCATFRPSCPGGQQQRVAIARALVKQPKVLLADEPTGNLDENTRDEIIDLLEQLWHDQRLTMVLITHDSVVASRAQRIAIMTSGRLAIHAHAGPGKGPGSPAEDPEPPAHLLASPANSQKVPRPGG